MLYRVPLGFENHPAKISIAIQKRQVRRQTSVAFIIARKQSAFRKSFSFGSSKTIVAIVLIALTALILPSSATAEDSSLTTESADCIFNNDEQTIAAMLEQTPTQNRPQLACHPILHQVARERALDMANRGYFYHVNPDGIGPNFSVQAAGYRLPDWWGNEPAANYIESIAAGYPNALAAWVAWMRSPSHRTHLLASDPFYSEQVNYGVGVIDVPGSQYGHYYVVLTAPAEVDTLE